MGTIEDIMSTLITRQTEKINEQASKIKTANELIAMLRKNLSIDTANLLHSEELAATTTTTIEQQQSEISTLTVQLEERDEELHDLELAGLKLIDLLGVEINKVKATNSIQAKRIEELEEGLRKLEYIEDGWTKSCPVCRYSDKTILSVGHKSDCWLSKLIGGKENGKL
jgi:hypothetical protein